jgi:hypothetical protein
MEQLVCEHHLVLGNLYALRGDFVWQAKQAGVRLPIGYIGEDGLMTSLANSSTAHSLPKTSGTGGPTGIVVCGTAFATSNMSFWHLS